MSTETLQGLADSERLVGKQEDITSLNSEIDTLREQLKALAPAADRTPSRYQMRVDFIADTSVKFLAAMLPNIATHDLKSSETRNEWRDLAVRIATDLADQIERLRKNEIDTPKKRPT